MVGIETTPNLIAVVPDVSTFSFPITACSLYSFASASMIGVSIRHGPHQVAQKSTTTRSFDAMSSSKF